MQSQDVSSALKPSGSRIGSILPTLIGLNADAFSLLRRVCWPLLDLGFRIWLAQQFFVSGVIKVTHWDTALDLAAHEYPVSWMSPTAAAYTGAAIEIIAPIIDRGNFHLFQPLLYQVATAALSPGDIAAPIRPLFRDAFNARVLLGTAHHPHIGSNTRLGQPRIPVRDSHLVGTHFAGCCIRPHGTWFVVTR